MAFGGLRSSCVRPGTHSTRHRDSHNDLTPCRMAWPFVSAGAHAPHSDERLGPTPSRGSSLSARRLRSLAFLRSSMVYHAWAGFWFVFKARQPAPSGLYNGWRNTEDGRKFHGAEIASVHE